MESEMFLSSFFLVFKKLKRTVKRGKRKRDSLMF